MKYLEIKFTLPEEFRDIIIAELSARGFDTFLETRDGFNTYSNDLATGVEPIKKVIDRYRDQCDIQFEATAFPDKNWNEEWEKNFEPIVVENHCLIRAPFHQPAKKYPLEILINPKMAFGTGHHATTYLMLAELMIHDLMAKSVIDLGCGTGVLAIAAKKMGADTVWATDINEWSINNSKENFKLNHCDDIELRCGQIEALEISTQFDLVLANINRNVLLEEVPSYLGLMKPSAKLVLSGFFEEDEGLIREVLKKCRLRTTKRGVRSNWVILTCEKEN